MKPHKILKSFPGSQTGNDYHHFEEGTVEPLSNDLAAIAVKEGWAKLHVAEEFDESVEEKAINEAPANKMAKPTENKRKK